MRNFLMVIIMSYIKTIHLKQFSVFHNLCDVIVGSHGVKVARLASLFTYFIIWCSKNTGKCMRKYFRFFLYKSLFDNYTIYQQIIGHACKRRYLRSWYTSRPPSLNRLWETTPQAISYKMSRSSELSEFQKGVIAG